ncbi:MAG: BatA domain-containing protein [Prolixibacteraceae bacterium]|nr:BatA domain-containing protein [Prolixibacteraceae bacterium]
MKFLFPTFLFALFTIAIPIIIHLFSFRRYKTVYFSNVGFLQNIKKESQKKSKLKQLLILIARILTLICLVFAFAQPYIPINADSKQQPNQLVAVYIDNSFSMNALSEQGQLLEVAKNKAIEIGMAHPAGTKFKLFTNDLQPKHQNLFNREQFIQQISEIETSPVVVPLSLIYNRYSMQRMEPDENIDKNLYVISDFQQAIADVENFNDNTIFTYFMPLVPNQVANLYIDSCWVEVPAHGLKQEEEIFVRIKNSSNQDFQNLPLKLILNDSVKSITNFSVSSQNEIVASLNYTNNSSGSQLGKIEISDYPFTHDNEWYISYFVKPKLTALAVFGNTQESVEGLNYISALFNDDNYIQLDEMNVQNLQMSKLAEYNTIFLINLQNFSSGFLNELSTAVKNGTSVVLFPGNMENPLLNNAFLEKFNSSLVTGKDTTLQNISGIDFENKFFANVFRKREKNAIFPELKGHFRFERNVRSSENRLLWFQNYDNALTVQNEEKGKIWVFSFPLNKATESFAKDILFVPVIYNIVLNSLPEQQLSYTIGEDNFVEITSSQLLDFNSNIEIENMATGERLIPPNNISPRGIRIETIDQITKAGQYKLLSSNQQVATLAFNYNRQESDLRYISADEIRAKAETSGLKNASVVSNTTSNFSEIFDELQNGKQLWKWFIFMALFFITAEVLIARLWR